MRRTLRRADAQASVEVVRRRQAGADATSTSRSPRSGITAIIGALGHRQEHADPLHQPAGRADGGRDPVRRRTTSRGSRGAALRHARRHIGMVFQEYNLVERLTVMENLLSGRLGYVSPWRAWRRKFPPEDIRRAFELLDVVGLAGFAHQPRRRAVRRPAPARRHRARRDAGAEAAARRRADVVARSRRPRSRSWSCCADVARSRGIPGADQHARRRARASASPTASSACPAAASCSTARRRADRRRC